ncbi:MAG: RdgB/HAM1 family non-canonical purine NTP pyrophosphatase [Flavobacteriales bacterium]|nr:RdgB/HAM1 family non-canonical purine NTP pyrophosphatase [Flavobacteriales bacterium]
MEPLLLCTGNAGKRDELMALLPSGTTVLALADAGLHVELPETGDTLEANALEKARYAFERTGMPCVADDTGLEVDALGGAPGVYSARYAGPERDADRNVARLLREMEGVTDRRARFRTAIAFVHRHGEELFHGVVEGSITMAPRGRGGFGYDPVFVPEGLDSTFAEMSTDQKNRTSHRARAMAGLVERLSKHG